MLTEQQKAYIVQNRNLDPTKWTVSDDGQSIISRQQVQQTPTLPALQEVSPTPEGSTPVAPQSSSGGAFVKSFAQNAIPTIGAGLGVAGALALAPETLGSSLLLIPLALGGGYAGGKVASMAQEAVEPEQWKQAVAQAQQEHPVASTLGSLATLPLGGFNPNPKNVLKAGGALLKLGTGVGEKIAPEEMANLLNVGAGSVIGGVQPIIQGDHSPTDIALNAAAGAAFNSPNAIGRKLGFHPTIARTITDPQQYAEMLSQAPEQQQQQQTINIGTETVNATPGVRQPDVSSTVTGLPFGNAATLKRRVPYLEQNDLHPAEISSFEAEGGFNPDVVQSKKEAIQQRNLEQFQSQIRANDYQKALQERAAQVAQEQAEQQKAQAAEQEAEAQDLENRNIENRLAGRPFDKYQEDNTPRIKFLKRSDGTYAIESNFVNAPIGYYTDADLVKHFGPVNAKHIITNATDKFQTYNPIFNTSSVPINERPSSGNLLKKYNLGGNVSKNQENEQLLTPGAKALLAQVNQLKEHYPNLDVSRINPQALNTWAQEVSALHGIKDTQVPGLTDTEGNPVKGTAHVGTQQTSINPELANAGTVAHENFHHIWSVMPEAAKAKLSEKIIPELNAYNEQRVTQGKQPFDPEEYLATEMGYRTVSHLLNSQGETPFKRWWNNYTSALKSKYGTDVSLEDLYRNHIQDLVNGKSALQKGGVSAGVIGGAEGQKNQEHFNPEQATADHQAEMEDLYGRYQNAYKKLSGLGFEKVGTHEFMEAWQNLENIKNENGGQVPVSPERGKELFGKMKEELGMRQKNEGAEEGISRNEYWKQRRAAQKAENDAIRSSALEQGIERKAGASPNTWINNRKSVGQLEPSNVPAIETQIKKALGARIIAMSKSEKGIEFLNKGDREDITQKVLQDIIQHGVDKDGIRRTIWRRTNQFLDEARLKQKTEPKGISLQKEVGEGRTAADIIAKEPEEIPSEVSTEENNVGQPAESSEGKMPIGDFLDRLEAGMDYVKDPAMKQKLQNIVEELQKLPQHEPVPSEILREVMGDKFEGAEEGITSKVINNPDTTPSQKWNFLRVMPELDVAMKKSGPAGQPIAKALAKLPEVRDEMYGKYTAPIFDISSKTSVTDKQKVLNILYAEDKDGVAHRDLLTNEKQRSLYDAIRSALVEKQNDQRAAGQKIRDWDSQGKPYMREAQINPNYAPSIMRANVIDAILERKGNYKQYQQQLLDYWIKQGASPEIAEQRLDALRTIGDTSKPNQTRFGANRISEGMGIPPELREPNLEKMLSKYFSRVSTDRAWHDTVETNPEAMNALDEKNPNNVRHEFEKIIEHIQGEPFDKDVGVIKSLNRVVTSALLGPMTNIHIGWSTLFNPFQYIKGTELFSTYAKALSHLSQSAQHAYENGYKRRDFNSFRDILDGQNTFIQKLSAASSFIGRLNGREWTDTASKAFAQALSEEIVPLRIAGAKYGDGASVRLMQQLDPYWSPDKVYSKQEQQQLASVLGGFIHGAHDYRTLPELMNRESIVKPFTSLMSWSVAQTNQWMKHVWEPATKGNIEPLLMSVLGAALGGYAIQQLRQMIADKKSAIPSITEIAQSDRGLEGNIPLLAYNFMQMASFTGVVGIGSVLAKDLFDMAYKNIPQGSTFPLDEAIGELASVGTKAMSAWMQEPTMENLLRIAPKAVTDFVRNTYQTGRIALTWASDYGITGENEEYRRKVNVGTQDLRRWKMVEGLPYQEQTIMESNPYLYPLVKDFKRTGNLGEAAGEIPALLQFAQRRSQGNPDVLKQEVEGFKHNSYQTMPSPQNLPIQFARYYQFLAKTYGPEYARGRVADYMQRNALNRIKSSMLPTF